MALKKKAGGGFSLRSESDVAQALERIEEISSEIFSLVHELQDEQTELKGAVNAYVIDNYEASEGFEDDTWKATKVVSFTRTWNVDTLEKLVPKGILKNITELKVVPEKIDQAVRAGKLDLDKISSAYEEKPKAPYVRITRKSEQRGESEAAALGDML